jgi:hypothetical protein
MANSLRAVSHTALPLDIRPCRRELPAWHPDVRFGLNVDPNSGDRAIGERIAIIADILRESPVEQKTMG